MLGELVYEAKGKVASERVLQLNPADTEAQAMLRRLMGINNVPDRGNQVFPADVSSEKPQKYITKIFLMDCATLPGSPRQNSDRLPA